MKHVVGFMAYIDAILSHYIILTITAPTRSTIMTENTIVYARVVMNGFHAYSTSNMNPKIAEARKDMMIKSIEYTIELITCAMPPVPIIFLTAWSARPVTNVVSDALIDDTSSIFVSNSKVH